MSRSPPSWPGREQIERLVVSWVGGCGEIGIKAQLNPTEFGIGPYLMESFIFLCAYNKILQVEKSQQVMVNTVVFQLFHLSLQCFCSNAHFIA